MQYKKSRTPVLVEDSVEVYWLELHGQSIHAFLFLFIADELLDIAVYFLALLLIFIVWLIGGVSFPTHLFLLSQNCLFVLILTLQADTELSTLDALIKTETVLLLAVRFLACTEGEVFDCRLVGMGVFVVMHIPIVLILQVMQGIALLLGQFTLSTVPFQLESADSLKVLVFCTYAGGTALPDHAYLPWSEEADAVHSHTALLRAGALMADFEVGMAIEVLLLHVDLVYFTLQVHSYTTDSRWLPERRFPSYSPKKSSLLLWRDTSRSIALRAVVYTRGGQLCGRVMNCGGD